MTIKLAFILKTKIMSIRKIKDHSSEINAILKQIDPNEENPQFNSIIQSLKGIDEEARKLLYKLDVIDSSINELKE